MITITVGLLIFALLAGVTRYAWLDFTGLIASNYLDELWDDEVSERGGAGLGRDLGESYAARTKSKTAVPRSLTSVDHRLASEQAGAAVEPQPFSSSDRRRLTAGSTSRVGGFHDWDSSA